MTDEGGVEGDIQYFITLSSPTLPAVDLPNFVFLFSFLSLVSEFFLGIFLISYLTDISLYFGCAS